MKNIKFYYNKPSLIFNIDIVKKKDYELLDVCCFFEIIIDEKVFFSEPDFPILEFWKQLFEWSSNNNDFFYNSLETDDNPLISFNKITKNDEYTIHSKWQMFNCSSVFKKSDLLKALSPRTHEGQSRKCTGDG